MALLLHAAVWLLPAAAMRNSDFALSASELDVEANQSAEWFEWKEECADSVPEQLEEKGWQLIAGSMKVQCATGSPEMRKISCKADKCDGESWCLEKGEEPLVCDQDPSDYIMKCLNNCTTKACPWKGVTGEETKKLLRQMRTRSKDPMHINQGDESFCGPAAFLHALAFSSPERYEQLLAGLLCSGHWTDPLTGKKFDAETKALDQFFGTKTVVDAYEGSKDIELSDWVTEAGVRQTENKIISATEVGSIGQLTLPDVMERWAKVLDGTTKRYGGYLEFLFGKLTPEKGRVGAELSGQLYKAVQDSKGQALAFLLMDYSRRGDAGVPDHWVTLQTVVEDGKGGLECVLKTWGRYMRKPCTDVTGRLYYALLVDFQGEGRKGISKDRLTEVLGRRGLLREQRSRW